MAEDGFSVAWEGIAKLREAIDSTIEKADEAAREIVAKSAALAEAEAKKNFEGAHRKGEPHVGGDKPNIVTGSLRRSIRADPIVKVGAGTYSTRVAPRMVYARRVELGWQGRGAHPYFRPGAQTASARFEEIAAEVWRTFIHS